MEHTPITTFDERLDDLDARLLGLSAEISEKQARLEAELSVLDNLEACFADCQLLRVAFEAKATNPLVSQRFGKTFQG